MKSIDKKAKEYSYLNFLKHICYTINKKTLNFILKQKSTKPPIKITEKSIINIYISKIKNKEISIFDAAHILRFYYNLKHKTLFDTIDYLEKRI
jgi:hypothetical protein